VLRKHFGQGLTDEGVHILDRFTGTGTFMVRLLQLGLIKPEDLAHKYAHELHANEILLLAYYIAAVNIETTYQDLVRGSLDEAAGYEPFPGLILTDTFQSWEDDDRPDLDVFPENNERLDRLKKLHIQVIVGNPPYSAGQHSANDDNQNDYYHSLDVAISQTYTAKSDAESKFKKYDSYIRAIKWATLRIKDRGVIAFVTNGGWLDSNTADGMRLTLADEFSDIHIYNLRGNQRTAGEQSRKEGGKVFAAGSRATVAITILVKDPAKTDAATIHYTDIGDYLARDDKLRAVATAGAISGLEAIAIAPNRHGDWLNQRREDFGRFDVLGGADGVIGAYSMGVVINRDTWVYGTSKTAVLASLTRISEAYANSVSEGTRILDSAQMSWSAALEREFERRKPPPPVHSSNLRVAMYRPFFKQHLYFTKFWGSPD